MSGANVVTKLCMSSSTCGIFNIVYKSNRFVTEGKKLRSLVAYFKFKFCTIN